MCIKKFALSIPTFNISKVNSSIIVVQGIFLAENDDWPLNWANNPCKFSSFNGLFEMFMGPLQKKLGPITGLLA